MANIRVYPPADGLHPTITVNGRTYTCAAGSTLDIIDVDARVMECNGWTIDSGAVGATAARPTNPVKNQTFFDTTLGLTIKFDGKNWRRPDTGAVA